MPYTAENLERTNSWLVLAENQNSTKICSPSSGPSANDTSTKQFDSFSNDKKPFICSLCGDICANQEIFKIHICNQTPISVFKCTDCKTIFTNKNDYERHLSNHFTMKTEKCFGKLCELLGNSKVKHKETQKSDLTLSRPLNDDNIPEEVCSSTLKTESDVRFGTFTSASCEYAFLRQAVNSVSHIGGNMDGVSRGTLVNDDNLRAHQCINSRLESQYFDAEQLSMGHDGRSDTESETFCNVKMTEDITLQDVPLNNTYALCNSQAFLDQAANSYSPVGANKNGVVIQTLVNGDDLFEHHYVNSSGDSHCFDTDQLLMDRGGRSEAESKTFLNAKMTKDTTLQAVHLDHNYALYHGTGEVHKHQGYDAVFRMASIWEHHDCLDDKPYECEDCGVSFLTVLNLQSDDCTKHDSSKFYACNDCELTFEDKEQLSSHCYIHQDKGCVTKGMLNTNFLPEQSVGNVNPLPTSTPITDNRKISSSHSVVSTNIKSSELSTSTSANTLLVDNISAIGESLQLPSSSQGIEEQLQALPIVSKETVSQPSITAYPYLLQLLLTEPLLSPIADPFNANSTTSTNATQMLPLSTSISNEVELIVPYTTNTFEGQNLAKPLVTSNNAEPFMCNLCGSSLSTDLEYQDHCCPQQNGSGIKNGEENFGNTIEFPTLLDSQTNCTREMPYLCPECDVTFTKKEPFLNHSCIQLGGKPRACHRCKVSFAEDKQLQTHYCLYDGDTLETIHSRNMRSNYWETDCMPQTDGMESLSWLCGNNSELNDIMHMSADGERTVNAVNSKTQVQTSVQVLKCVDCNETFTNLETYHIHCQGHANDRQHKCSCGASFRTKLGYERHSARHSGMPHTNRPYTCQECGKSFKKHRNLLEHHAVHSGEKSYKCDLCDTRYATKKRLKNHLVSHSRRYVCDECGHAYSSATYLRIHSNIHTGVRPFTCSYCLKTFKTSSHLNHHVRSHTGDRPYKCQACNATFADSTTYRNHLSVHTAKSVLCETCGTTFNTKRLLKRHQITHSDLKPFECPECGKRFSRKIRLVIHTRIHTGERPCKCKMCGASFIQKAHLNKHLRTMH